MKTSSSRQDQLIVGIDKVLRTLCGPVVSERPTPGAKLPEPDMGTDEKRHSAALMRVNHTGEICAQALYQGQSLTARDPLAREALELAAKQETEHLAWTASRIDELGGRTSRLNPMFYLGSFAIGGLAGLLGDKFNLGFLAETERQVEGHLDSHLERLPNQDNRSRAILTQMKEDEAAHARTARSLGGDELPTPVKQAMKFCSRIMTGTTYWI
jgi:3-demethoxyubiquinol 3-hydroxylase